MTENAKPAALPATTTTKTPRLAAWEGFQAEINSRADEIGSQLPSNLPRDRFINAAIAAVKQTPGILAATPRSLFASLVKAAQDGLLPDGREGVITTYNQKVSKRGEPDRYETVAQWNPMIYGLRKRARELDGIIIDAQVVYANDEFEWEQGDEPHIAHRPTKLGTPRGDGIGAYVIFRHPEQGILHREVMDKQQIEDTRAQSRAKDSLMWTKFWTEGWRKTVARRGVKSVPVSPQLERLIRRDDEVIDLAPSAPAPHPRIATTDYPNIPDEPGDEKPQGQDSPPSTAAAGGEGGVDTDAFLARLEENLEAVDDPEAVESVFDEADPQVALVDDADALARAFELKQARLNAINRQAAIDGGQGDLLFPGDRP